MRPLSALVVLVPEAEPLVGELRRAFDPSAREGMAAHITILVPFVAPDAIGGAQEAALERAFARTPAFEFELRRIGRFPETVYLEPQPSRSFIDLTTMVHALFPDHPPYGGVHAGIVPHLTVSDRSAADAPTVHAALERALARSGAVSSICKEVQLVDNATGKWRVRRAFALAPAGT
jgi:2'-5' RNA ligase